MKMENDVACLSFSPDGGKLLVGFGESIRVLDPGTGARANEDIRLPGPVVDARVTPWRRPGDGALCATTSGRLFSCDWDIRPGAAAPAVTGNRRLHGLRLQRGRRTVSHHARGRAGAGQGNEELAAPLELSSHRAVFHARVHARSRHHRDGGLRRRRRGAKTSWSWKSGTPRPASAGSRWKRNAKSTRSICTRTGSGSYLLSGHQVIPYETTDPSTAPGTDRRHLAGGGIRHASEGRQVVLVCVDGVMVVHDVAAGHSREIAPAEEEAEPVRHLQFGPGESAFSPPPPRTRSVFSTPNRSSRYSRSPSGWGNDRRDRLQSGRPVAECGHRENLERPEPSGPGISKPVSNPRLSSIIRKGSSASRSILPGSAWRREGPMAGRKSGTWRPPNRWRLPSCMRIP